MSPDVQGVTNGSDGDLCDPQGELDHLTEAGLNPELLSDARPWAFVIQTHDATHGVEWRAYLDHACPHEVYRTAVSDVLPDSAEFVGEETCSGGGDVLVFACLD